MTRMRNMATTFIVMLTVLVAAGAASAQPADVDAKVGVDNWTCTVGAGEIHGQNPSPTAAPTASVQLVRSDATGFVPVCVEMPAAGKTDVDFVLVGFPEGVTPAMQATAFAGAGCTSSQSPLSPNACLVKRGTDPLAPIMLMPEE